MCKNNNCNCTQTSSINLVYKGADLACIPVLCGTSYEAALTAINEKICEIVESIINIDSGGNDQYALELDVNDLNLLENGIEVSSIDLSKYLDNINLQSLSVNNTTKVLTATLTNLTSVSVDLSGLFTPIETTAISVVGGSLKTLTLNQSNGNTLTTSWADLAGAGTLESIQEGANITVDDTDASNPIVSSLNTTNSSVTVSGTTNKTLTITDSTTNTISTTFTDEGIRTITAGTNITVDDTDPLNLTISASGGGATNLAYTQAPNQGTVTSDTGTDAIIPFAATGVAGLIDNEVISFTPSITIPGLDYNGQGNATPDSAICTYRKIGNIIFGTFNFSWTEISNMVGSQSQQDIIISNIPFTYSRILSSEVTNSTNQLITFNNTYRGGQIPFEGIKAYKRSLTATDLTLRDSASTAITTTYRPLFQYSGAGTRGLYITFIISAV